MFSVQWLQRFSRGTEVLQRWCRGTAEVQIRCIACIRGGAEKVQRRCRGSEEVLMERCGGAERCRQGCIEVVHRWCSYVVT